MVLLFDKIENRIGDLIFEEIPPKERNEYYKLFSSNK